VKQHLHGVIDRSKGKHVIVPFILTRSKTFWPIIKRGVLGAFHKVNCKYFPLYVTELQFHYNQRENADIFGAVISGC
jgi:hypothetical protein